MVTSELSRLTRKETGLTFNPCTTQQAQEQTALVYLPQAGGSGSLAAEVYYIWLPADSGLADSEPADSATADSATAVSAKPVSGGNEMVSLWLSCHPLFVRDVWRALDMVFELNLQQG